MNKSVALKFAVSALAIGTTMVACGPVGSRIASASTRAPKGEQEAASLYAKAQEAVRKAEYAEGLGYAERAVELSPRDVGYRMILGDLYLKNGRFQSAETTFADVQQLDPSNSRASFSIALARIALGRPAGAVAELDRLAETASPADIGLAYALAGDPRRAIELLEPAARAPGVTARTRQNLALSYALAGEWEKARITAAQDLSPADLGARLQQWAALAQPGGGATQVAALLGVTPAEDPGQPVRLALAQPEAATTALASAGPLPEPAPETVAATVPALAQAAPAPESEPVPEPVQVATSDLPQWVSERAAAEAEAPAPAEETRPLYAEAVEALVTPQPSVVDRTRSLEPAAPRFEARPRAARAAAQSGAGRFAVQLGAYSSPSSVEKAWSQMLKRFGFVDLTPLSTTVSVPGRGTLHRLSVAGFASREAAGRTCRSIQAKGGACFVRTVAGDAPVRWAGRYSSGRRG
ncbi:MAG TPA: tetratricopeptide repeat protein [Allosphingosinicella sp.]|jgi:Flp pilus assembly protein TadD|nr:tetratricopeptide repeat protein [Allosphingosinicella sp.]